MDYSLLFKRIMEMGSGLISSGADGPATRTRLELLCEEYKFEDPKFFVNTDSFQGTAIAPDGSIINAIEELEIGESNYGKLSRLDALYRTTYNDTPSPDVLKVKLDEINNAKYRTTAELYIASILGGVGFSVMFGCNLTDSIVALVVCALITLVGSKINNITHNQFIYNIILSAVAEYSILLAEKMGLCEHPDRITLGIIMLLISGLGITSGIWGLISKDTSLGFQRIIDSTIGAVGIVAGIYAAFISFGKTEMEAFVLHDNFIIQTVSCTIACIGFAVLFCVEKKHIPYIAIGACLTWLTYSGLYELRPYVFTAVLGATVVESLYALLISFRLNAPPAIIMTVSIFPVIPGANLFYMMYAIKMHYGALFASQGAELLTTCIAIAVGYSIVEILLSIQERNLKEIFRKRGTN